MTARDIRTLRNPEIFREDYKGGMLFTPAVLMNTQYDIVKLIDDFQSYIGDRGRVVIHCLWESGGHVNTSQHYKGRACDFHVSGMGFVDALAELEAYLENKSLSAKVGLGIYPSWKHKGFHIDTRGEHARWGQIDGIYVDFCKALDYANKLEKKLEGVE